MVTKKTIAVVIGTLIGILIGLTIGADQAEMMAMLGGLILVPFLIIEARYGIIGQDVLGLGFGALVGALIGTMRGDDVMAMITGALTGTGLAALLTPLLRSVGIEKRS
jgi:hypothetical protein